MISNIALFPMAQRFVAILCKWFFAVEIHAFADENHISWNCSKHLKAVSKPFQLPTSVLQQHTLLWLLCQFFWRKWTTISFSVYNYPILPHATGFDRTEIGLSAFRFQDFNQKIVSPWFFSRLPTFPSPEILSRSHQHPMKSAMIWCLQGFLREGWRRREVAHLFAPQPGSPLWGAADWVKINNVYWYGPSISIYLSIDRSIDLSIYCIYLSVYLSIYLSIYLPTYLAVYGL